MIDHFRALFPRWNFYDRIAHHFEIDYKLTKDSLWQPLSFSQPRKKLSFFYNPDCNLALAEISLIEQFVADFQKSSQVTDLTTYRMLKSVVIHRLNLISSYDRPFQFKILACKPGERIDFYVSDWMDLK